MDLPLGRGGEAEVNGKKIVLVEDEIYLARCLAMFLMTDGGGPRASEFTGQNGGE